MRGALFVSVCEYQGEKGRMFVRNVCVFVNRDSLVFVEKVIEGKGTRACASHFVYMHVCQFLFM